MDIKAARESAGISQAELAKRLGIKQQQISKWESGKQDITIGKLKKIAEAIGKELYIRME